MKILILFCVMAFHNFPRFLVLTIICFSHLRIHYFSVPWKVSICNFNVYLGLNSDYWCLSEKCQVQSSGWEWLLAFLLWQTVSMCKVFSLHGSSNTVAFDLSIFVNMYYWLNQTLFPLFIARQLVLNTPLVSV